MDVLGLDGQSIPRGRAKNNGGGVCPGAKEAIEQLYRLWSERHPTLFIPRANRGLEGDYSVAVEDLRKALEKNPSMKDAAYLLSTIDREVKGRSTRARSV